MRKKILLSKENPYSRARLFSFDKENINPMLIRRKFQYIASENDEFYTVKDDDNLLRIAADKYGNDRYWVFIADANDILFPMDISDYTSLIIPDPDKIKSIKI